ncbi:serine protease inhibitor ecotin [Shewanella sp. AS1]|uniref:serine protease inhibitor ecotin n=1 Tax=Shewanella sp. AS1 TaxID=2907626 RepID=UPI001F15F0F8|nr:serine protease inhibitor ecotin [Shewanella sp. AS1]MCE9678528.1 serine protease inhibitor ecotin [Shewanella sp. AS1]
MKAYFISLKQLALASTLFCLSAALICLSTSTFARTLPKPEQNPSNPITIDVFAHDTKALPDTIKMFPIPDTGMELHLLTLEKLADETRYKIEIEIGITAQLDCNKHRLIGNITEQSLPGWGYPYYRLNSLKLGASTRMACLQQMTKSQFIALPDAITLAYDSRLPKLFYLPEGSVLRYKIWQSKEDYHYSPNMRPQVGVAPTH